MRIFIGGPTREAMGILKIKAFPFSEKELKLKFGTMIHQHHEDKGGNKDMAIKVIMAYKHLKNLASSDDKMAFEKKYYKKEPEPWNPVIPKSAIMKGG